MQTGELAMFGCDRQFTACHLTGRVNISSDMLPNYRKHHLQMDQCMRQMGRKDMLGSEWKKLFPLPIWADSRFG